MTGFPSEREIRAASVRSVVAARLCTGCGTCVCACPQGAVRMRETPAGLLEANVSAALCSACGSCLDCCPGRGLELLIPDDADAFRGRVLVAYRGFASDSDTRARAQSGGLVTALLTYLLESGAVDEALITETPKDGSLRPHARRVASADDVLQACGSKYCPVAANAALTGVPEGARVAAVCLGCHAHGVRLMQRRTPALRESVPIVIGLVCDRVLMASAVTLMCRDAGIDQDSLESLEYRSKERSGWPGEVAFVLRSGERLFRPSALRTESKEFMTPPRCRLCFDKFNVLSDIVVGDPWGLPAPARQGESILLARTERGREVVDAAAAAGYVTLHTVESQVVFRGQSLEAKREAWRAAQSAWRWLGGRPPRFTTHGQGLIADAGLRASLGMYIALMRNLRVAQSGSVSAAVVRVSRQRRRVRLIRRARGLIRAGFRLAGRITPA